MERGGGVASYDRLLGAMDDHKTNYWFELNQTQEQNDLNKKVLCCLQIHEMESNQSLHGF